MKATLLDLLPFATMLPATLVSSATVDDRGEALYGRFSAKTQPQEDGPAAAVTAGQQLRELGDSDAYIADFLSAWKDSTRAASSAGTEKDAGTTTQATSNGRNDGRSNNKRRQRNKQRERNPGASNSDAAPSTPSISKFFTARPTAAPTRLRTKRPTEPPTPMPAASLAEVSRSNGVQGALLQFEFALLLIVFNTTLKYNYKSQTKPAMFAELKDRSPHAGAYQPPN